jgi:hypothetical protein
MAGAGYAFVLLTGCAAFAAIFYLYGVARTNGRPAGVQGPGLLFQGPDGRFWIRAPASARSETTAALAPGWRRAVFSGKGIAAVYCPKLLSARKHDRVLGLPVDWARPSDLRAASPSGGSRLRALSILSSYLAACPYARPGRLFDLSPTSNPYYQPVGLGSPDGASSFAG